MATLLAARRPGVLHMAQWATGRDALADALLFLGAGDIGMHWNAHVLDRTVESD